MDLTPGYRIKALSPQLVVTNIDRSIEFYCKILAFEIEFGYGDFYVGLIKDGNSIHLKSGKPSIAERKSKSINEDVDILISIQGIEHLYDQLTSNGCNISQELRQMPYGKEFYVVDPDGYIIAFCERNEHF